MLYSFSKQAHFALLFRMVGFRANEIFSNFREKKINLDIFYFLYANKISRLICVNWFSLITSYCAMTCEMELEEEERLILNLFIGKQFSAENADVTELVLCLEFVSREEFPN